MRLFLLFLPLLSATAQNNEAQVSSATQWLTDNAFNLNMPNTPTVHCKIDDKDGKCVTPDLCKEVEKDPTTLFDYREFGCDTLYKCCPLDQVLSKPNNTKTLPNGCGWTNPGGYSIRSTDTDFSEFAEFPWMVAVLKNTNSKTWNKSDYIGGATLIHPSVVLTVAHSVYRKKPNELKCRAGEWDTESENELAPHQDRAVRKIAVHDAFKYDGAHFDAALLFLASPFDMKDMPHIGTACLARDMPQPNTLCYSMGWGHSFNDSYAVTLLKKVQLPLVHPEICQRQLRNTKLGSKYVLDNSLTCAGGQFGRDMCSGDGGSSLVCQLESDKEQVRYLVHGMVAYGVGPCGQKDVPGVYAKVPVLLDWIKQEMTGEQLTTDTYLSY